MALTGDGISTPDNTDFEFGSGDFTVECWVKQDDTSGFDQFVGKYGGSGNGEYIVERMETHLHFIGRTRVEIIL